MASIFPFAALRPEPHAAPAVAAVPYDVVSTDEARALADGNSLSFLHVSRAEIDLPAGVDPHADEVYERAAENFRDLRSRAPLVEEDSPAFYVYRLQMGAHTQTGIAACFSIDEYDRDVIRKHEKTRPDKEDDRTRHMLAIGAQTGPVFLSYPSSRRIDAIVDRTADGAAARSTSSLPTASGMPSGPSTRRPTPRSWTAFAAIPTLYIADGHHRAASAARTRRALSGRGPGEHDRVLAVAFPDDQVQILPYNRVVRDLNGMTPSAFLDQVKAVATVSDADSGVAARKGRGGDVSRRPLVLARVRRGRRSAPGRRARRERSAGSHPGAASRHRRRAHRQADRFCRRHSRRRRARAARRLRSSSPSRSRCFPSRSPIS